MDDRSSDALPDKQGAKQNARDTRLWRNRSFSIFWFGQTLSAFGDAFAMIALPLLVLQATGSVAIMGLVTAVFTVGEVLAGIFSGQIVDRLDRRSLMIFADTLRFLLYIAIPLCWLLFGPQIWLIFVVVALGSCMGMVFNVTYITAITQLVESEQIIDANGRLQVTSAIAFVTGPVLAGLLIGTLGASTAIACDAASFAISAISLSLIRFRQPVRLPEEQLSPKQSLRSEFLAGLRFLWQQPVLRSVTILLAFIMFLTAGALDIFLYHIKHDLQQTDSTVGLVFGLASVGGLLGGLTVPYMRRRLGFGICWIGGFGINCLTIALIGISTNLELIAALTIVFTFSSTIAGVASVSLRQEITPNHLLGRVTSAFWTISQASGPLGAAVVTALAQQVGTSTILPIVGLLGMLIAAVGLLTPIYRSHPEQNQSQSTSE